MFVIMNRLVDTLARRRILYPRPIVTLPDILVIDIPAPFASASLSLGRYYPIMIETGAERRELDAFLAAPREGIVAPDLLDRRASALVATRVMLSIYAPPESGWPFVLLCHWPKAYTAMVADGTDMFARGAYTVEMFETEAALLSTSSALIATLGGRHEVEVSLISAEGSAPAGSA